MTSSNTLPVRPLLGINRSTITLKEVTYPKEASFLNLTNINTPQPNTLGEIRKGILIQRKNSSLSKTYKSAH
jgi:hypothetical protein